MDKEVLGQLMEQIGADIQRMVDRAVNEKLRNVALARVAFVATSAELGGTDPISTRTGPNGPQTMATIWLDDDPETRQPVSLPVRPGVTLTGGEVVRVERSAIGGPWAWIDGKV